MKKRLPEIVFCFMMAYFMTYSMEVYNTAIKMGFTLNPGGLSTMTNIVFWEALKETLYMGAFGFALSYFIGSRIGKKIMEHFCDTSRDNAFFCRLVRQGGTVLVICPAMSLIGSVLFNIIMGDAPVGELPAIWVGTLIKNFPMAVFYNFFFVSPFVNLIFKKIFPKA